MRCGCGQEEVGSGVERTGTGGRRRERAVCDVSHPGTAHGRTIRHRNQLRSSSRFQYNTIRYEMLFLNALKSWRMEPKTETATLLHSRLMAFFQDNLVKPVGLPGRKNYCGFKWGERWWDLEMQRHQLDDIANNLHLAPDR